AQETPTFQSSLFKYHDGKMLEFETRGGYSNSESGLDIRIGNIFYGTGGHLELERTNWRAFRKREKEPFAGSKVLVAKTVDPRVPPGGAEHYANFIDAIRAGSDDVLNCDISEGFLSTSLPLLANISYRLKRELKFVGDREKFHNDKEANTMLTRKYRPPYIVPEQV
ncbi:MAG TPA: gfo/Idh/MocA family oxidoreductase, partial [Niabella sp.]|nr:gfo/Idh/MocA family oxidoreductase [Niabella sp.]